MNDKNKKKYLYVGCGNNRLDGFLHLEIDYAKKFKNGVEIADPEFLCDITKKLPFLDSSVELVFSRETLEHLTYRDLINHLIECHRVLKKGGKVRICVPDLDLMVQNFINRDKDFKVERETWEINEDLPTDNHSEFFVAKIMYHDHYYNHNFETLSNCLKKVGFDNIVRSNKGDFNCEDDTINSSLKNTETEKGKNNLLIVTGEKILDNPKIEKFVIKEQKNLLNIFLSKYLNLEIRKSNKRKPRFPQKLFFKEKFFLIKKLFR